MKQDDYTLWAYGVILLAVSIKAALWLLGIFIKLMFGVPA